MPTCPLSPGSTVVAYARDSGGASQDRSVSQQLAAVQAYCTEHRLVLLRTWADEAQPGSSTVERVQFQDMIRWLHSLAPEPEARKPRDPAAPDGLLYWAMSRFSRDQDTGAFFRADLRRRGYKVVSLSDDIPAGDVAPVVEALLGWKAEQDLTVLSSDIKRGLMALVLTRNGDGGYLHAWPGKVPPGFRKIEVHAGTRRDGRPRLVQGLEPDKNGTWELIQRAYELRLQGMSLSRIHELTRVCPTRTQYRWLLRNPIYKGTLQFSGQTVDGWIEPCVSEATWAAVQSLHGRPKARRSQYPLSGLLRCGECGATLGGKTDTLKRPNRTYVYRRYVCTRAKAGWDQCGQHRRMDADLLEHAVFGILAERVLTYEALAPAFDALDGDGDDRLAREVATLEAEQQAIGQRIGRYVQAIGQGADLAEVVAALKEQGIAQKQGAAKLSAARQAQDAAHRGPVPEEVVVAFCEHVAEVLQMGNPETVKEVLRSVIVTGTVWADGRGVLEYRSPWSPAAGRVEFRW